MDRFYLTPETFSGLADDAEEDVEEIEAMNPTESENFDPDVYANYAREYLAWSRDPLCSPDDARRFEAVLVRLGRATGVWVGPIPQDD